MFRESVPTHAGSVAGVGGRRGVRFNPLLSVQLCGGLMHWPQWILWLAASVVVIVDRSLDFHGYGEVRVEGDRGEHTAGTSANHQPTQVRSEVPVIRHKNLHSCRP